MNTFLQAIIRDCKKIARCSNSQDKEVLSSTVRIVIGCQFVREKLSIVLLF